MLGWPCALDSAAATLIAQENARPYFAYRTFYSDGENRRSNGTTKTPVRPLLPSPMLTTENPQVRLYFEVNSLGEFSSPIVPPAEFLARVVPAYLSAEKVSESRERLEVLPQLVSLDRLLTALPAVDPPASLKPPLLANLPSRANAAQGHSDARQRANQISQSPEQQGIAQSALNVNEFLARSQFTLQNSAIAPANNNLLTATDVRMTVMKPIWLDGQLLLARRVLLSGSESVQGCWLDWETLKGQLQATIIDLLPDAVLQPADSAHAEERSHMMAVLPVELVAGEVPVLVVSGRTPVRLSLWVTWCSLALAAVAVALLLQGVLALSERRAAFVSAVTHELRTPLTTFCMYVDMLAEGMVSDEQRRSEYLKTLRREADRLTHLVENVLAYARLERGGPGRGSVQCGWQICCLAPATGWRVERRKPISVCRSTLRPKCSIARWLQTRRPSNRFCLIWSTTPANMHAWPRTVRSSCKSLARRIVCYSNFKITAPAWPVEGEVACFNPSASRLATRPIQPPEWGWGSP